MSALDTINIREVTNNYDVNWNCGWPSDLDFHKCLCKSYIHKMDVAQNENKIFENKESVYRVKSLVPFRNGSGSGSNQLETPSNLINSTFFKVLL